MVAIFYNRISVQQVIPYFVGYLMVMVLSVMWLPRKFVILFHLYYVLNGKLNPMVTRAAFIVIIIIIIMTLKMKMLVET